MLGLSAASIYGSFTTSGSTLSLIYDAMTVAWNNGGPAPERMPGTHFALVASDGARGRPVQFDLRGFCTPSGAGRIRVEIDGQASEVTPAEEDFCLVVAATLNPAGQSTRVIVNLDLPEPADGAAVMLTLDSIDARLPEQMDRQTEGEGGKE